MRVLFALGIVAFLVGLLGGLGYALRVVLWSGEPLGEVARPGEADTYAETLALEPAMNPLRATLDVSYSQPLRVSHLFANVTLRDPDGRTVWTRRLRVHDSGESGVGWSSSQMPVERFDVQRAGPHTLEVRLEESAGGRMRRATVKLRRNVQALDWGVIGAFAGVGIAGLLFALGVDWLRDARAFVADVRGVARDVRGR